MPRGTTGNHSGATLRKPLRIAVVDDSLFVRRALERVLAGEETVRVVGLAASGEELLSHLERWRPDVITLDLEMPGMDGLETLERLGELSEAPVIVFSQQGNRTATRAIEALHRGAADLIDKQVYSLVDFRALREVLLEKIAAVTSLPQAPLAVSQRHAVDAPAAPAPEPTPNGSPYEVVVMGASTGGPPVLQEILEQLGPDFSIPVVIVQHMPVGFTSAFAQRLDSLLPIRVREPEQGETLEARTAYIAPAGQHLRLRRAERSLRCGLSGSPSDVSHVPSIEVLFQSAATVTGAGTIGVLLTGMGHDGAQGMLSLHTLRAHTIVQSPRTCTVPGLPQSALALGAVREIAPPHEIGRRLRALACPQHPETLRR